MSIENPLGTHERPESYSEGDPGFSPFGDSTGRIVWVSSSGMQSGRGYYYVGIEQGKLVFVRRAEEAMMRVSLSRGSFTSLGDSLRLRDGVDLGEAVIEPSDPRYRQYDSFVPGGKI